MEVTLKIKRFNPETDDAPHFVDYTVDVEPTDRVLDALNHIKWYIDGSLTYRRSCAHGVCGSDAMQINNVNRLACRELIQSVDHPIVIEPMKGLPLIKDLVVDMDPFFAAYKAIKPFLMSEELPVHGERLQSQEDRQRFDDTTRCILCAACTTSCPIFWANEEYIGPASIVNAHRFIFDSRDQAREERLDILNDKMGVWRCRTIFNCTDACPRDIKVTRAIEDVKRAIMLDRV